MYPAIYHVVTSTFRCSMSPYSSKASWRVYGQVKCALNGEKRPHTARDIQKGLCMISLLWQNAQRAALQEHSYLTC